MEKFTETGLWYMRKADLLTRAEVDLGNIQPNIDRMTENEFYLDAAAYHIQQAVEKIMKYVLAQNGIKFPYTHKILELCEAFDSNGIDYPEWIYKDASLLTEYAEKTRYGDSLVGNKRKVIELLKLTQAWFNEIKLEEEYSKLLSETE